jgi:ABC-type nickel/cobalt efflux system permease component RcnA
MAHIKQLAKSLLIAFVVAYASVIVFLGFGPVYVAGELAVHQSHTWTAILTAVLFVPIYLLVRSRSKSSKFSDTDIK